nr:biotin-dependent carboxyltransferase family protein [uncultured Hyphomonas sp.]
MSFKVLKPGVQATLQAAPRSGTRQLGVPASGPADSLSMALANRLVGNPSDACAIEMPFGLVSLEASADCTIAFAGAPTVIELAGNKVPMHRTLNIRAGEAVSVGAVNVGARIYMAVSGGFLADDFLGSTSTCLPAMAGGLKGRALQAGDRLSAGESEPFSDELETPVNMIQAVTHAFALRCVDGPDADLIPGWETGQNYEATRRADRTGVEIAGSWLPLSDAGLKPSAPVFPGTVQLTPSGNAFVLLSDCQTTGGYPHVLQVIRADRHLLGQIRPGDRIHFLKRTPDEAATDLRRKTAYFREWLPDLSL